MRRSLLRALVLVCIAAPALAQEPKVVVLQVEGMNCFLCPITVRKALQRVPGVLDARADLAVKRAQATFDPTKTTPESLADAVTRAGFPATVRQP